MRSFGVLALIDHVFAWQDRCIEEIAIEVDGEWYVPAWIYDPDVMSVPAHRLWELYESAGGR